jgi:hypothetical protein
VLPVQYFCRACQQERLHVWRDHAWHCIGCDGLFQAQKLRPAAEISTSDNRSRGGRHCKLHAHRWVLSTGTSD